MTRKKILKGIVLRKFKLGDVYEVHSKYSTTDKKLYDHLINTKRIK